MGAGGGRGAHLEEQMGRGTQKRCSLPAPCIVEADRRPRPPCAPSQVKVLMADRANLLQLSNGLLTALAQVSVVDAVEECRITPGPRPCPCNADRPLRRLSRSPPRLRPADAAAGPVRGGDPLRTLTPPRCRYPALVPPLQEGIPATRLFRAPVVPPASASAAASTPSHSVSGGGGFGQWLLEKVIATPGPATASRRAAPAPAETPAVGPQAAGPADSEGAASPETAPLSTDGGGSTTPALRQRRARPAA